MTNTSTAQPVFRPAGRTWLGHLEWLGALAAVAVVVPALFVGLLHVARSLYLVFYVGSFGAFLYGYVRWSGPDPGRSFARHWAWGLVGGAILALFTVKTVLIQPSSPAPGGPALVFDLAWLGVVYGSMDALVLSVVPVYAVWHALAALGWSRHRAGRIGTGMLAVLASMLVIGVYHLGYPEYRGAQVLLIVAGVSVQSLAYLLTRNALTPMIGHVGMHVAAVLHGINTVSQLPPHYH